MCFYVKPPMFSMRQNPKAEIAEHINSVTNAHLLVHSNSIKWLSILGRLKESY
jgi:hypothetical protein